MYTSVVSRLTTFTDQSGVSDVRVLVGPDVENLKCSIQSMVLLFSLPKVRTVGSVYPPPRRMNS